MTNVDNLLQLGLIFFTSALQLNRKPFQNMTESDSVQGESQGSYSTSGGSIWTLLWLCVFTLKSNVIKIKSINYVAYLGVSVSMNSAQIWSISDSNTFLQGIIVDKWM